MLNKLRGAGYGAYFVGGCVRDTVLGRRVHDWDAATSAPPQAVQALFERTAPTGLRHGTVTVLVSGRAVEVTTAPRAHTATTAGRTAYASPATSRSTSPAATSP